jgi:hypothetical protein
MTTDTTDENEKLAEIIVELETVYNVPKSKIKELESAFGEWYDKIFHEAVGDAFRRQRGK